MIRTPARVRRSFAVGVLALWSLWAAVPSTVFAQQGPASHDTGAVPPQDSPGAQGVYDSKIETTFIGTVADIETGGPGRLGWLMRVHTLGLGHKGAQETHLLVNTDTGTVQIHLGPTAFVQQTGVEIKEGDTLEVIGSRVTLGDSEMVLAREIRKGANAWTFRDATGQPLWSSVEAQSRRFWTRNKIVLTTIVVAKVVALATVLRH